MPDVDLKQVETKIQKGETLTAEETKAVMSEPPAEAAILAPTDDFTKEELEAADAVDKAKGQTEDKSLTTGQPGAKEGQGKEAPAKVEDKAASDQSIDKIYKELDKPEGQEDLTNLTHREKGIFWEYRRERKARQKLEEENTSLKLNEAKRLAAEKKAKDEQVDSWDKGMDPEGTIKVKDLKGILDKVKPGPKDTDSTSLVYDNNNPIIRAALKIMDDAARVKIGADYDETVECMNEIVLNNPAYLKSIAEALAKGENAGIVTYNLIKGDPEYTKILPVAKARLKARGFKTSDDKEAPKVEPEAKADKAVENQAKLEDNLKNNKTSAHVQGEGGNPVVTYGGYTTEQCLAMSDAEFHRKVQKKDRDAFFRSQGVKA